MPKNDNRPRTSREAAGPIRMEHKKGHSNVYVETIWVDPTSGCAMVRLRGGATAMSVKELPPLAMRQSDWLSIGKFMGWGR